MLKQTGIIQSVDRALQILETLSNLKKEVGVTELAQEVKLHKSTTFGILNTLQSRDFVQQNCETGKYSLGIKLLELGNEVYENMDTRRIIRPFLREISRNYDETVHYAIEDNGKVVYIEKIESSRAVVIKSSIGKRNPMHCTGVGKCLLAYMKEEKLEKILSGQLQQYTENTITDPEEMKKELLKIRSRGYSIDDEEIEIGLRCIAAPVLGFRGVVVGGISISGPSIRMTDERIDELIQPIKDMADLISKSLGYDFK